MGTKTHARTLRAGTHVDEDACGPCGQKARAVESAREVPTDNLTSFAAWCARCERSARPEEQTGTLADGRRADSRPGATARSNAAARQTAGVRPPKRLQRLWGDGGARLPSGVREEAPAARPGRGVGARQRASARAATPDGVEMAACRHMASRGLRGAQSKRRTYAECVRRRGSDSRRMGARMSVGKRRRMAQRAYVASPGSRSPRPVRLELSTPPALLTLAEPAPAGERLQASEDAVAARLGRGGRTAPAARLGRGVHVSMALGRSQRSKRHAGPAGKSDGRSTGANEQGSDMVHTNIPCVRRHVLGSSSFSWRAQGM